ncbi:MAG: deoxyribodipyrimidine photo-lyase [Rhodobacteraceae bacterium]|nr:deoxyribodipyrimidine photo-lyase [Paracoccaceae bacterium]
MTNQLPVIALFREDLRLTDNLMLTNALQSGRPLICLYIHDDAGPIKRGSAQRWWLHHSLLALNNDLKSRGCSLNLRVGDTFSIIRSIVLQTGATEVYWSRRYAPYQVEADKILMDKIKKSGVSTKSCKGRLIKQPWEVLTASARPYRVFTPFWKSLRNNYNFETPLPPPNQINGLTLSENCCIDILSLLPKGFDWSAGFHSYWQPGEGAAQSKFTSFLENGINDYASDRDFPNRPATSQLSPHLQMGEISPRQIIYDAAKRLENGTISAEAFDKFYSELVWREFSYHLLYHFPKVLDQEFLPKFRHFPWQHNKNFLTLWQQGQTGYPIVDAGMRELWHTGYMHNRVRMIVASFLTKHLLIDWRLGMQWFWDTLVDADIASNTLSWQWVAGCGADAAPYFRIFNPVLQARKFDPDNQYILRWVPELSQLPSKHIPEPWTASAEVLRQANVCLGSTYPHPIIEHKFARDRALSTYSSLNDISNPNNGVYKHN